MCFKIFFYTAVARFFALFCTLMLLGQPQTAFSQSTYEALDPTTFRFFRYTIDEGLSQGTVRAIEQDAQGFIWFGTQDGLNRFDGYDFTVYKNEPTNSSSLNDNWVTFLYKDQQNLLWVGTRRGLNLFESAKNQFLRLDSNLNDSLRATEFTVRTMFEDTAGNLWMGSTQGLDLVNKIDTTIHRVIPKVDHPARTHIGSVLDIFEDKHRGLWIGTSVGLFQFDPNTFEATHVNIDKKPETLNNRVEVRSIFEGPEDLLWIATYTHGLILLDPRRSMLVDASAYGYPQLEATVLEFAYTDRNRVLWIGTGGTGLYRLDPGSLSWSSYTHNNNDPYSLTNNHLLSVTEDSNGSLWFGAPGGISRLDANLSAFRHLKNDPLTSNSLSSDFIWSISEDQNGRIWIGTFGAGLNIYDPSERSFQRISTQSAGANKLVHNNVGAIFTDNQNRTWIGNNQELLVHLPGSDRIERALENSKSLTSAVRAIAEDNDILLVATFSGLYEVDLQKAQSFPLPETAITRIEGIYTGVTSILPQKNAYWLGSNAGLIRLSRTGEIQTFKPNLSDSLSLSNSFVTSIASAGRGNLWVGTTKGLNYFDVASSSFTRLTEKNGLPNSYIYGVLSESPDVVWVSTNRGISRVDASNLQEIMVRNFSVDDGLQGNEFNTNAYFRLQNGDLLFGGTHGLTWFNPTTISLNTKKPPVVISEFSLFNEPQKLEDVLQSDQTIYLKHNENELAFGFAALNFIHSERNQYAYRLRGLRDQWSHIGNRRSAYFTNLNPGNYTFEVKATNNDGIWNEAGASIRLTISPPFWQRTWFRLMIYAGALGLLYATYRFRVRQLEAEKRAQEMLSKKLIETQEDERARIARELHDGLGQNLLIIKNAIERFKSATQVDKEQMDAFSLIAQDSIDEVRTISSALHPHQLDRLGLTEALTAMVQKTSQLLNLSIKDTIEPIDKLFSPEESIHVYRVVQEALNNVVRHAKASKVEVGVENDDTSVSIIVADNGIGFDHDADAPGLGLAGIKERVRILQGNLTLQSSSNNGTTLKVVIPRTS